MPDHPHLSRAPILEAMIHFQANASARWNPERVRQEFAPLWSEHSEVEEMHQVQVEFKKDEHGVQQHISLPGVEGFFFRSKTQSTAYQVRRDGFALSWLKPYPDWQTFQAQALAGWKQYAEVFQPPDLHTVVVRFINRLEFPQSNFQLARYFTAPPRPIPELGWKFLSFMHQAIYDVPSSGCVAQVALTNAFDPAPDSLAFILDTEIKPKEPLAATGRPLDEVLSEMRGLKNAAFFGLLTPAAISRYL